MSPISYRLPVAFCLTVALTAAASCKDDDGPKTAFDETKGIWSVVTYDLGQGNEEVIDSRTDGYLLRFVADEKGSGVVAAAACQDSSGNHWPNNSSCHIDPGSQWNCRCFRYEFEENTMYWLEFNAGSTPPAAVDPMADDVTEVKVEVDEMTAAEVLFQPLPEGLFGSRQDPPSTFRFRQRSETVWNSDDGRPPDALPNVCDACFPAGG